MLAIVLFPPTYGVPNPLMNKIQNGTGQIRKDEHAERQVVPVGDGKNNDRIGDEDDRPKSECFDQRPAVVLQKRHESKKV